MTGYATSGFGDFNVDELMRAEAAIAQAEQGVASATKERISEDIRRLVRASFLRRVRSINEPLISVGRFCMPTYVQNSAVHAIEELTARWNAAAEPERSAHFERLLDRIAVETMHPHYRGVQAYRAYQLAASRDVAVYLDKAHLHFYRQDYWSCMLTLLPAVEKLMLRHIGHLSTDQISTKEMRERIAARVPVASGLEERFMLFQNYVVRFIERFQVRARNAMTSSESSQFFRNVIYHVAEDRPYYTYTDCVSLLNFFDLYFEMLALEVGAEIYGVVPDDTEVRRRTRLYWKHILDDYAGLRASDDVLLGMYSTYRPEARDRNYLTYFVEVDLKKTLLHGALQLAPGDTANLMLQVPSVVSAERRNQLQQVIKLVIALSVWSDAQANEGQRDD